MKRLAVELAIDSLAALGAAMFSYGAWRAWAPAGFLAGGLCLFGAALILARPAP